MKILCKLNNNGKIIAACEKDFPQPGWLEINVPDDFSIHNATYYSVVNGDIIFSGEDNDIPQPPTPEERIAALEEELAAAKILLGLED